MFQVLSIILFILSFFLIFTGGNLLVSSAIWISKATKISPIVVGATIVSIATTLPETSVSLIAVKHGDFIFATSNALGSMICNFALILGIAFTALPSAVDIRGFWHKSFFLILDFILILVFSFDKKISNVEAISLLIIFVLFIVSNIFEAKKHKNVKLDWFEDSQHKSPVLMILQFVVGAIAIAYGSHVLVTNTEIIGQVFHINQRVLALTVVAIGTGLPEIVTTLTSIRRKSAGIGVGNMLGANIMNGTMLLGLCGILSGGDLTLGAKSWSAFLILGLIYTIAIVPVMLKGKSFRAQGILLLSIYVIYVFFLYLTG